MPNGYGYGGGRGRGGYGGRSSYQYQQPATAQYESFFNPIPIEFLQENLQQHQGQFDQAFAGALAAKEAAQQQEIALDDEIYRDQLIGGSMQKIDALADKYGGDYGRAAKDIAREVTNLRGNEFWASSKHLKEQQALQQKTILENPNMWLTGDVMNKGAANIDPETGEFLGIRTPDELTFKGVKHGDWAGSLKNLAGLLTPDKEALGLSQDDIDGMLKYGSLTHIDDDKIEAILENTSVVNKFLADNPDFKMAFEKGLHYQDFDSVEAAAKDYISGGLDPTKFKQVSRSYTKAPDDGSGSGDGSDAMILTNLSPDFDMTVDRADVSKKALKDLEAQRWEVSQLPDDDPRKVAVNKQAEDVYGRMDLVMNTVEMSPEYGISRGQGFTDYQTAQGKSNLIPEMTEDEYMDELNNHIQRGTDPEAWYYGSTETSPGVPPTVGGESVRNPMSEAVDGMRKAMARAIKDEKGVAVSGKVVRGTSGNTRVDTKVESLNDLGLDTWKRFSTDFIIPNTGQQVEAWLDDKYPADKGREKNRRDRDRDEMVLLNNPINGKLSYVLTTYNKSGARLATIPIAPGDQANFKNNILRVASDIGSIGYTTEARELATNSVYKPIIQEADIYSKAKGTFEFSTNPEKNVHFEKSGSENNPVFKMYLLVDGEKDYFRESEDGDPIEYTGEDDMLEGILDGAYGVQ